MTEADRAKFHALILDAYADPRAVRRRIIRDDPSLRKRLIDALMPEARRVDLEAFRAVRNARSRAFRAVELTTFTLLGAIVAFDFLRGVAVLARAVLP